MALRAAGTLHLELHKSIVVGDRPEDIELANNIGAESVYIGTIPSFLPNTPFPSLAVAASYIIERLTGMANRDFPTMSYEGASGYFLHYADEIRHQLANVSRDPAALMRVANVLAKAYGDGSMVFIAGNGGAAAIANHMETDHVKHMSQAPDFYTNIRSLCSNQSVLTAIANDIGYDAVFSKQLETYANKDDVLVVFSVSGNSANVVRATQRAIEMGMRTVAVVGSNGGKLANIAENVIHIPSNNYGVVEDVMSIIQHVLAQFIRQTYMSDTAVRSARF
jgi:phosphoheptose isomerase